MKKLLLLVLLIIAVFFLPSDLNAQTVPQSGPVPVACNKVGQTTDFHSLRPYQASPCTMNIDEPSRMCGNTMIINDTITVTKNQANSCTDQGNNTAICHYSIPRSFQYQVDASQATLPIAGNTEQVTNRYSADATIDRGTQINDYLSWYLNGTIFRAESFSPFVKNDTTGYYDFSPIIDYSGPIRKLLPLGVQNALRTVQVNKAGTPTRHDQTVACIYNIKGQGIDITTFGFKIFKWDGINIGGIPAPCPSKNTNGNIIDIFLGALKGLVTKEIKLSEWQQALVTNKETLPPEPKAEESWQDYYLRYRSWRGDNCITVKIPSIIPVVGGSEFFICYDDTGNPNFWANEFPWVPFTSTEDKLGSVTVESPVFQSGDVTVSNASNPAPFSSNLNFAHMEENSQLASQLSASFVPYDLQGDTSLGDTTPVESDANCKKLDVRSTSGDKLFGATSNYQNYSYTADFDCSFTYTVQANPTPAPGCYYNGAQQCTYNSDCCSNYCDLNTTGKCQVNTNPIATNRTWSPATCVKHATFAAKVETTTPMIDSTWAKLVAGNTSAFRRMFPKIDPTTLGVIKDIPAATNVIYKANNTGSNGETVADTSQMEIYFPHLGGISEYFLKGIQTLLRPKGYGESTPFEGGTANTNPGICGTGGSVPTLPPATGACVMKSGGNLQVPDNLARIISAAATTYNVPPSLILGIMFSEGAFNASKYGTWTIDKVNQWSGEGACMPGCTPGTWPSTGVVPFFENDWAAIQNSVKAISPNRQPNVCNLLDVVFALAKEASQNQYGSKAFAGKSCFGIPLNAGTGGSTSCSWSNSSAETAIRIWEFGTAYRDADLSCVTKENSCYVGGSLAAQCPTGGDTCETITNRYADTSNNGCIWDTYQNYR